MKGRARGGESATAMGADDKRVQRPVMKHL
jgi:hypothetical protein